MKMLSQIPLGTFGGIGKLGSPGVTPTDVSSATSLFENALSLVVGVMTVIAGIWFLFGLLTGAVQWLASGGDKQALQNAQKKIFTSIVGLTIVIAAYGLIYFIGNVLGFKYILNPAIIIETYLHP